MTPDDIRLSLFEVSSHLGVSPSAVKKRVVNLNLPVLRGARGKLIFDARAYALLQQADELLKAGHGFEECRRQLGLEAPPVVEAAPPAPVAGVLTDPIKLFRAARRLATVEPVTEELAAPVAPQAAPAVPTPAALTPQPAPERQAVTLTPTVAEVPAAIEPPAVTDPSAVTGTPAVTETSTVTEPVAVTGSVSVAEPSPFTEPPSVAEDVSVTEPSTVTETVAATDEAAAASATDDFPAAWPAALQPAEPGKVRALPPPIMVKLGRSKSAPPLSPDMLARLDAALRLLDDKDRQNQMLQSKLLVAYDEMTKLSATAAAFQERSLNLAHEVQKLQGEMRLLAAPPSQKPWWKFWT